MVDSVMSVSRSGVSDWLIQRVTAVLLALYVFFLVGFIYLHSNLNYNTWHALFANGVMQVMSLVALISIVLHAWVGMWTVITDYIKPAYMRLTLEVLLVVSLIGFLVWGVEILWRL